MKTFHDGHRMTRLRIGVIIGVVWLLVFVVAFLWKNTDPQWLQGAYARSAKKLHLLQTMSNELLASAEAEKSAVMADTDEASKAYADQSLQASLKVEDARRLLEQLLQGNRQESQRFLEFSNCWDKLQEIDKEVLSLAVQNTNLKAFQLSFIPAADAMKRMEQALNHLMDVVSLSPDAVSLTRLSSQAIVGTLNIYALHAPHIAESSAARMDDIEAEMQRLESQVTESFHHLQAQAEEPCKPLLHAAWAAYQDFQKLTAEIVTLSRNNSNIRSFTLSLGQKRNMTAECQDMLTALRETVQQGMSYKATR
jgi:Four helix bundle sensory module for signal transduction